MPAAANLMGRNFGRFTVISTASDPKLMGGRKSWLCRCVCGREETHPTSALTSGRVFACDSCEPRRRRAEVDRTCSVCGTTFRGDAKASICSAECRRARRRGRDAGVDHLSPPRKACSVCGVLFTPDRSQATCSAECRDAAIRRNGRSHFHRKMATPGYADDVNAKRRKRAKDRPEVAEERRRQWREKHQQHRLRMLSDPVYAAEHRDKTNARYREHSADIRDRRRKRLDSLGPAELAAWLEQVRLAGRKYRRKWRGSLATDPEKHQKYLDLMKEYRRRRAVARTTGQLRDITTKLETRLNNVVGSGEENARTGTPARRDEIP